MHGAKLPSPLPSFKLILSVHALDKELKSVKSKLSLSNSFATRLREELRILESTLMLKEEGVKILKSKLSASKQLKRTNTANAATFSVGTQYDEQTPMEEGEDEGFITLDEY